MKKGIFLRRLLTYRFLIKIIKTFSKICHPETTLNLYVLPLMLKNALFRSLYVPLFLKVAEITMIPKPGKPLTEVKSYRPISLLPNLSKLYNRILQVRIKRIIEQRNLVPKHQFDFRNAHSTIDYVHHITDVNRKSFGGKKCFYLTVLIVYSRNYAHSCQWRTVFCLNRT